MSAFSWQLVEMCMFLAVPNLHCFPRVHFEARIPVWLHRCSASNRPAAAAATVASAPAGVAGCSAAATAGSAAGCRWRFHPQHCRPAGTAGGTGLDKLLAGSSFDLRACCGNEGGRQPTEAGKMRQAAPDQGGTEQLSWLLDPTQQPAQRAGRVPCLSFHLPGRRNSRRSSCTQPATQHTTSGMGCWETGCPRPPGWRQECRPSRRPLLDSFCCALLPRAPRGAAVLGCLSAEHPRQ